MPPTSAFLRTATPSDVPALVTLVQSAYRGDVSRQGWTTEADLLDGQRVDEKLVLEVVADARSLLLVLDGESGPLACCHVEDKGEGLAYFGMFAVRPGAQGAGTGRAMVAAAERRAVEVFGATTMEMTVIAQRVELIGWYERLGFTVTGETRPFPYGVERFGTPRRSDLYFEVLTKALGTPSGD